jgi:hypothetical protein
MMPRLRFVVLAFALGFSTAAFAQMSPEQRAACQADYDKYYKGAMPGGGRIVACLSKQFDQLAPGCKQVIAAQKK